MTSLEAPNGFNLNGPRAENNLRLYTCYTNSGKTMIFCWIPSHVNISGKEKADAAAKWALSLPITNMKLPACDYISTCF